MKINELRSRTNQQKRAQTENIENISHGITKKLLEKYRPKITHEIESVRNRQDQKRVA